MKKTATFRALLMSTLSLLLCVSVLVGTTFAWFTDSATSAGNIIKSGTLDVEMYWADGKEAPTSANWKDASSGAIFNYDKWEPGYAEVRHVKIENKGTLALKYQINIIANGEVSELSDVIDVYYVDPAAQITDRTVLTNDMKLGTLTDVLANIGTSASGNLEAGENHTITLALKMQESAGNEYQNLTIGADFSVQLLATQLASENDSFDDQYDVNSEFPVVGTGIVPANAQTPTSISAGKVIVDIPTTAPAGTYTVSVTNGKETKNAEGKTVLTADIDLLKDGVKVESDGNVKYLVKINLGPDKAIAEVLHKGVAITVYDYDAQTGILQFETDSFSPFAVIYEVKRVVKVDSAEAFIEALANVTEKTEIDATGVTLVPTNDLATTIVIPAGVTVKGATFAHDGESWLLIGEGDLPVAFENCTFIGQPLSQFKISTKGCDDITYTNCTFNGFIMINNTDNRDAVNTFNNCSFGLANGFNGYVNCMAATSIFNQCTFNYTGGSTMGSNQYMKWNAVNSYSENTNTLAEHNYTTYVELNGCIRNNCATHKNTANSTLVVK